MAIDLGVMIHWEPARFTAAELRPMITWIGPVILMTAAIVPFEPWKMLLAGCLAASMDPVGMLIGGRRGLPVRLGARSAGDALPQLSPAGRRGRRLGVVTKLGQQVTRARRWGVTAWATCSGAAGWARSTSPITACSPVRPRSS